MKVKFRPATLDDLPDIVRLLADDFLGASRERYEEPLPESYVAAFNEIEADKNNEWIIAFVSESPVGADGLTQLSKTDTIVGSLQLTFTPSISFQGGTRATVGSVRVDSKYRGQGIGREMMLWAIQRAMEEGCVLIQLTTNSERTHAHRFYENLGFKTSHVGMKLSLK